jgi:solute carrier family 10 (sodium/bile acid cotransporter), member 7
LAGSLLQRLKIDPYLLMLVGAIALASLLPARGPFDVALSWTKDGLIALLFFLQGARLSREAVISGLSAGRLHILVVAATYLLFPVLALALNATGVVPKALQPGMIFLACLPSTVQSSIAFVSVARGNVAAAVCAASLSNILAVALTPLLVALLLGAESGGFSWGTLRAIAMQLLLPFVIGQLARPLVGGFIGRHRKVLSFVDRGSILLVVYSAFGHAVVDGIWSRVSAVDLILLILVCCVLLAVVLVILTFAARLIGLKHEEAVVAVICGSQKSLASGAPMAGLLFASATAGMMILPLMVFHQVQLIVASVLASRYARHPDAPPEG